MLYMIYFGFMFQFRVINHTNDKEVLCSWLLKDITALLFINGVAFYIHGNNYIIMHDDIILLLACPL